jgi:hypothetical protein
MTTDTTEPVPIGTEASARAHLERARECGELDDDTRLGLMARGVKLGAIQGQHVAMAQAAATVALAEHAGAIVAELGRLRLAAEVLVGDELDRRADRLAGAGPFDQDEPARRVVALEAAIAEALDELGDPSRVTGRRPAPVANAVAILRAVER